MASGITFFLLVILTFWDTQGATAQRTSTGPAQIPQELYSPLLYSKVAQTANNQPNPPRYPQYTDRVRGEWRFFDTANTWTTGFFPATLYALNEREDLCPGSTGGFDWLALGRQWAAGIVPFDVNNHFEHDVGFVSYPFQYELTLNRNNQTARRVINNFATSLANRYSATVGCTRSWDTSDPTDFTVIVDNMMNLQLLFLSAELTGNSTLRQIAITHADKTIENFIRPDGSSFHVVEFNSTTGRVIRRRTAQGYANNSTWTRGQAWGLYGFALMYENTGFQRYLDAARRMATFFRDSMPSDGIVPWDFNAPLSPPRPADSSATTVAANGLLLLSKLEHSRSNFTGSSLWTNFAIQLLDNLTKLAWKPEWQSLLSNGTVNNPANPPNNLTGIVYGDYYYVTAGNELLRSNSAECPS